MLQDRLCVDQGRFAPKGVVEFIGKPITPRGLVICHGEGSLFEISEGEKLLIESTLLHRKAVRSNKDALS